MGLENKKLFVGIPMYKDVDSHFVKCLMQLVAGFTTNMIIYPHAGDSLVCRARNHITRCFLESDCTHLLMIDSDLIFDETHVRRILELEEDLVGGIYCKKQEGPVQLVANACDYKVEGRNENGLLEVKYIGTGFMRISRKVFEIMIQEFGNNLWYTLDGDGKTKEYDFWSVGMYQYPGGTRRYLSEDWFFCQRAIDAGFKVWMDLKTVLRHSGNAVYPLKDQEKELFARFKTPVESTAGAAETHPPAALATA